MAVFILLAVFAAGCAGSRKASQIRLQGGVGGATPPVFIAGPGGALLTNTQGFSAHATVETTSMSNRVGTVSGTLLGQGGSLLFAPDKSDRSYLWNVADGTGCVMSEALQGYAPAHSGSQAASVGPGQNGLGPMPERANGFNCRRTEEVVTSADGTMATFRVWRAADLNGLAVRVASVNGTVRYVVNLSGIRLETLPASLFTPPGDFTKYSSPEALMTELIARDAASRKRGPLPDVGEMPPPGSQRGPAERRY